MGFEAISSFFGKVSEDGDLGKRVQDALDSRAAAAAFEIVDIAKTEGCEFTATELREYLAAQSPGAELTDTQLEAVAGGLFAIRSLDLTGLRGIRKLSVDLLRARRQGKTRP